MTFRAFDSVRLLTLVSMPCVLSGTLFAACGGDVVDQKGAPIVNGEPTAMDKPLPFVVAIGTKRSACSDDFVVLCTGSLITPDAVLTAAHCFSDSGPGSAYEVFVGDQVPSGTFVDVVRVDAHPDFDPATRAHDVALVRLGTPVTDVPLGAITDEPLALEVGAEVTMAGFGTTDSEVPPDGIKRTGRASVAAIDEDLIRTGGDASITCQGDSGGPLFASNGETIVAVSSSGDATCMVDSVFARVHATHSFLVTALSTPLPARPQSVDFCGATCVSSNDCPLGLVCAGQPSGARCIVVGQVPGSLEVSCDSDADCDGQMCVRANSQQCACLSPCADSVSPPGMPGGSCSVSWGWK